MIVHFVGPTFNLEKNIKNYRKIIQVIHEEDGVLARDWVETVYNEKISGKITKPNWTTMCEELVGATERADLVIVDASGRSTFGVGFQGAIALEKRKPTLWLRAKKSIPGAFVSGYQNNLIMRRVFTDETLEKIVRNFLRENQVRKKDLTFNFIADRQVYSYLRTQSLETGRTKADVLRDIILEDLHETEI